MSECIFCKIINGEIPADVVYESDDVVAFNDIKPAAPVHVLIVPKTHISNILSLSNNSGALQIVEGVLKAVPVVADKMGLSARGFRIINNCGREGGQTIDHLHFHLIGGLDLGEKLI
jgi:histidine triad (HIT) family protein